MAEVSARRDAALPAECLEPGLMHHKRGRRKDIRAGCLLCKPHKANGQKGRKESKTWQELKSRASEREQLKR